jgi:peptidoglycan/LPS O-acetylase OafA/YrhL
MGRRVLRIFPAYYLTVLILFVLNLEPAREFLPWLITYTYNYGAAIHQAAGSDNSLFYLWSLSVEEQFYLLWPFITLSLKKSPVKLLLVTSVIVVLSYA